MPLQRRLDARPFSRRALLWAAVSFVAAQAAFRGVVEWAAPSLRDPVYYPRVAAVAEGRRSTPGSTAVLLLGSSRVQWGLRANTMSRRLTETAGRPVRVHDFSRPACGPLRYLMDYERLRRDGVRPDAVVLEVFLPLLHEHAPRPDCLEQQLPAGDLDAADVAVLHRFDSRRPWLAWEQRLSWASPSYSHRLTLASRVAPWWLLPAARRPVETGADFVAPISADQRPRATKTARDSYEGALKTFVPGGPEAEALAALLNALAADGVPVLALLMPEGPTFRGWHPPGIREAGVRVLRAAADPLGIPVVDTRDWCGEDDFIDSYHLLPAGAEAYSRRLCDEALSPWLKGGRR